MPIRLVHRPEPLDVALAPARIAEPGGTIGRCAGNALVLPDARGEVGRLQAVVRWQGGQPVLRTLASGCPVRLNGAAVELGEQRPLRRGDELVIGRFVLHVDAADAANADVAPAAAAVALDATADAAALPARAPQAGGPPAFPAPDPDVSVGEPFPAAPQAGQPAAEDVFADLMGPGTLPVGSPPDVSCHPFDMDSAARRNAADPLAQLPPEPGAAPSRADPLALLADEAGQAPDVFSDRTPSALGAHGGADPIAQALARPEDGPAAQDHSRQVGGYMRPAAPVRPEGGQAPSGTRGRGGQS
ncbi:FHA domain-containing protein [Orrella sp. JC864]|uniref:FHA domain-containing protein n=1 Tax=Orrella sp. JC864 TaxID=3120298 RepID=UPI0012BCFB7F